MRSARSILGWWLGFGIVVGCEVEVSPEDEGTTGTTADTTSSPSTTGTTGSTGVDSTNGSTGVDSTGGSSGGVDAMSCSHILPYDTFGVRGFGSPTPDLPFGVAYVNAQQFEQEVVVFDSMCNPTGPFVVAASTDDVSCAMWPNRMGGECVNRNPSSTNLVELDAGFMPQAPVEFPLLPGEFVLSPLPPGSPHGDFVLWTLNGCCDQLSATLIEGNTATQTWADLDTLQGGLLHVSQFLADDDTLTWVAAVQDYSFQPQPSGRLHSGVLDLATGPMGPATEVEVATPTPLDEPSVWDSLTNAGSWERVFRVSDTDPFIAVTDYSLPDLVTESTFEIQLTGGTLTKMAVARTPSGREFMLAQVVIDGAEDEVIRLYEIPEGGGSIDATSGDLVDDNWTTIKEFYANDHGLVMVLGLSVPRPQTLIFFATYSDLE